MMMLLFFQFVDGVDCVEGLYMVVMVAMPNTT